MAEKGADIETKDKFGTPVSLAASNGHEAVVQLLVEKGANVEMEDTFGHTPLSLAARNGHKAVVRLFCQEQGQVWSLARVIGRIQRAGGSGETTERGEAAVDDGDAAR
jgi:ankyrin repeat protein